MVCECGHPKSDHTSLGCKRPLNNWIFCTCKAFVPADPRTPQEVELDDLHEQQVRDIKDLLAG